MQWAGNIPPSSGNDIHISPLSVSRSPPATPVSGNVHRSGFGLYHNYNTHPGVSGSDIDGYFRNFTDYGGTPFLTDRFHTFLTFHRSFRTSSDWNAELVCGNRPKPAHIGLFAVMLDIFSDERQRSSRRSESQDSLFCKHLTEKDGHPILIVFSTDPFIIHNTTPHTSERKTSHPDFFGKKVVFRVWR